MIEAANRGLATPRALFVGNITLDNLGTRIRVGGPGFYGGIALSEYLGVDVYVLTSVNDCYEPLIKSVLSTYGVKILPKKCEDVAVFRIEKGKVVAIESEGCKLEAYDVFSVIDIVKPDILFLTPVYSELGIDLAKEVTTKFRGITSIDIQGFVRRERELKCVWSDELTELITLARVVHGNVKEFCVGENVVDWLHRVSRDSNAMIIASMDERGCYLAYRGEVYEIPTLAINPVDDVGAGDVLTAIASYYLYQGYSPLEAACRGVAAAALKVENAYSKWFDRESLDVLSRELLTMVKKVR